MEKPYIWVTQNPKLMRFNFFAPNVYQTLIFITANIFLEYLDPEKNWTHWLWAHVGSLIILCVRPPKTIKQFFVGWFVGYTVALVFTPVLLPLGNNSIPISDELGFFVMGFFGYALAELLAMFLDWVKKRPAVLWEWYLKIKSAMDKLDKEP